MDIDPENSSPLTETRPTTKLRSFKRAGIALFVFVAAISLSAWLMIKEEVIEEPVVYDFKADLWDTFYYCKDKKFCIRFRALEEERVENINFALNYTNMSDVTEHPRYYLTNYEIGPSYITASLFSEQATNVTA